MLTTTPGRLAIAVSILLAPAIPAVAASLDGLSLEAATGSDSTMLRFGVQRKIERTWFRSERRHVAAYWDMTLASWRGDAYRDRRGDRQRLWDIGLTPVFRYQRHDGRGWYGEAGIGVHYLTQVWNNGGKALSTHFQFGDHVGVGYLFSNDVDVTVKFQHYSNGGFKKPNDGANFVILKAGYPF